MFEGLSISQIRMHMAFKNDIIVIGGPTSVEAAIAAAPYADSVVIISEGIVGDWGKSKCWSEPRLETKCEY